MKKILTLIAILVGVVWLIPAYFTIQTSFLNAFTSPLNLLSHAHLENWRTLPWHTLKKWALNSLIICATAAILSPLVCISAGYAFVRYNFPGKDLIFYLFLLAIAMPGITLFLPRYMMVATLDLTNTYIGLILPGVMAPISVFFARQYLSQINFEIVEAARLDGASELRILRSIIFPLAVPLIVLNVISGFGMVYGDFMWQYLVGRDIRTTTVGIGLFLLGTSTSLEWGGITEGYGISVESIKAAASILQSLPSLILFVIGQKYFVKGMRI